LARNNEPSSRWPAISGQNEPDDSGADFSYARRSTAATYQAVLALPRTRPWPQTALQLIGDGMIVTLNQHIDADTAGLARDCVVKLRSRG
jgi:hypothetical protein